MAKSLHPLVPIRWRIVPLEPPRVLRRCPRCCQTRPFSSTGKFRVNAQKRRVDVWLVYRCSECDLSWKATVLERCCPGDVANLAEYHDNDPLLARRHAFDRVWLQRFGSGIDDDLDFRIVATDHGPCANKVIEFAFEYPLRIRLDRLLSMGLNMSRSRVVRLWKQGAIMPVGEQDLRRPAQDGAVIWLRI